MNFSSILQTRTIRSRKISEGLDQFHNIYSPGRKNRIPLGKSGQNEVRQTCLWIEFSTPPIFSPRPLLLQDHSRGLHNHVFIVQCRAYTWPLSFRVLGASDSLGTTRDLRQGGGRGRGGGTKLRFRPPKTAGPLARLKFDKRIGIRPISLQSTAPAQGLDWYMPASISKLSSFYLYFSFSSSPSRRSRRNKTLADVATKMLERILGEIEIGAENSWLTTTNPFPPPSLLAQSEACCRCWLSWKIRPSFSGSFPRSFETKPLAGRRFFFTIAKRRGWAWGGDTTVVFPVILSTFLPFSTLPTYRSHPLQPPTTKRNPIFRDRTRRKPRRWAREKFLAPLVTVSLLNMLDPKGFFKESLAYLI